MTANFRIPIETLIFYAILEFTQYSKTFVFLDIFHKPTCLVVEGYCTLVFCCLVHFSYFFCRIKLKIELGIV